MGIYPQDVQNHMFPLCKVFLICAVELVKSVPGQAKLLGGVASFKGLFPLKLNSHLKFIFNDIFKGGRKQSHIVVKA